MIDGFKCSCLGVSVTDWINNPQLDFCLSVSESTGELLTQRKEAKCGALYFVISPTAGGSLSCSVTGSLHKHSRENQQNADDFTFTELCDTLNRLHREFGINLSNAAIHSIEIGVNIRLAYPPKQVFKAAICHKGKAFNSLDRRDKKLGLICEHTDYAIKLYDKGYQNNQPEQNILRYELKLKRQRMLEPYSIRTLADLQCAKNVILLLDLLIEKLNEIIFFDFSFKVNRLTSKQRLNWERYSNPKYWESLNRFAYCKARKRFAELREKYGASNKTDMLTELTVKKWIDLFKEKHKTGLRFPQVLKAPMYKILRHMKADEKVTFSNLEYLLENVTSNPAPKNQKNDTKVLEGLEVTFKEKEKRFCISCGREITNQRKDSRFCSERLYGKQAKKCRNKDSNKRLAERRKQERQKHKIAETETKLLTNDLETMGYNRKNTLKRIIDIQDLTLQHTQKGVTQEYIYNNYIYPVYLISRSTYYTYLATNAKAELKRLEDNK